MKEKINIVEILKDCPRGMELDCAICENVYFDKVESDLIKCFIKNDVYENIYFYRDGTHISAQNAKCVIFPKGKTTWEGFVPPCQFKDGDVLYIDCNCFGYINKRYQYIFILKEISEGKIYCYCYISSDEANTHKSFEGCCLTDMRYGNPRFATEEEKQKLFKAIEDNGYKWNPETKTLERLVKPKFKVGDRIKWFNHTCNITAIHINGNTYNYLIKHDDYREGKSFEKWVHENELTSEDDVKGNNPQSGMFNIDDAISWLDKQLDRLKTEGGRPMTFCNKKDFIKAFKKAMEG